MKKILYSFTAILLSVLVTVSCSLDTKYHAGEDMDGALTTVPNLEVALTGAYYTMVHYAFAGRNVPALFDLSADLSSRGPSYSHFKDIVEWTINDNLTDLYNIWYYGYRAIAQASRVIDAGEKMAADVPASLVADFNNVMAQAYAIKALSTFYLVNIFALPYKVEGGIDNGETQGIVISDTEIKPGTTVTRTTVAKTYEFINRNIQSSLDYYRENNYLSEGSAYLNIAAVYALKARVALLSQDYTEAITAAETALQYANDKFQKSSLAYTVGAYTSMYDNVNDNGENIFYIQRSSSESFTANSIGTLYSSYQLGFNDNLINLFNENDIRLSILAAKDNTGKFQALGNGYKYMGAGNSEISNIPLFRLPELYLILAEANLKQPATDLGKAASNLLIVAKRNPNITSVSNLPADFDGLNNFIKAERARELCLEGHRFSDLRRWGEIVSVSNGGYINFDISKFSYPIPVREINAGYGVEQTPNWWLALPTEKPAPVPTP